MEYQREQIKPELRGDFGLLVCRNTQTKAYRLFVTTPSEPLAVQRKGMTGLNLEEVQAYEGVDSMKVHELYEKFTWNPSEEQIAGLDALLLKPQE